MPETLKPSSTSAPPTAPSGRSAEHWIAVVLRVGPLALFLWMVKALLIPIILGALFALILFPLQKRLAQKLGRAARYAPAIVTSGSVILIVVPLVLIGTKAVASINDFVTKDLSTLVQSTQNWLSGRLAPHLERFHVSADSVRENVESLVTNAGRIVAAWFGNFAATLPGHVVEAFLFVIALYFFLRDGRSLSRLLQKLAPFPPHDTEELFSSIAATVNGAILGELVTAALQGALTMLSLYLLGVPGAFLLGITATLLAVIPMVGTTPITLGAAIYLFVAGRFGAGVGMLVMAAVIGVSDNIIRPWVQNSQTTMHPLLVLLSIFGGLEVFGAAGIFIGPVLSAIAVWVVDTYTDLRLKQLQRELAAVPSTSSPGNPPIETKSDTPIPR